MSYFLLKCIALLAMTIDHIGIVYGKDGWHLLPFDSSILRIIGRISFPLFAFCLSQGWHKTRHRKRYFRNLTLGSLASQIPFTLALYPPNLAATNDEGSFLRISWPYLFFSLVAVWIYWRFALQKHADCGLGIIALAALVPGVQLKIKGVWVLCENLNVFYTFLMSFLCLYVLEHRYEFEKRDRLALFLASPALLFAYGLPADYGTGLLGIMLIVGFTLLDQKEYQVVFLLFWSIILYGILVDHPLSMLSCALVSVFILLYRPTMQRRFKAKKLFYCFYPMHLLLLGAFNILMR